MEHAQAYLQGVREHLLAQTSDLNLRVTWSVTSAQVKVPTAHLAAAFAFGATKFDGGFKDLFTTAQQYGSVGHPLKGTLLMIILLNASIIGACAVSLATSYTFGDTFKANHSLHRSFGEAKLFYSSYAALIMGAGAVVVLFSPFGNAISTATICSNHDERMPI